MSWEPFIGLASIFAIQKITWWQESLESISPENCLVGDTSLSGLFFMVILVYRGVNVFCVNDLGWQPPGSAETEDVLLAAKNHRNPRCFSSKMEEWVCCCCCFLVMTSSDLLYFHFFLANKLLLFHLMLGSRGLAGVGAEAMLATSTRLLAALLNHADSAEWFRTFGDEEVEKTTVKEEMDAQMPGCWWNSVKEKP